MVKKTMKQPTRTGPGVGAIPDKRAELEAARDAVNTATANTAPTAPASGDGWSEVADSREAEGWIPTEAFTPGNIIQGRIIDALLVADDEKGGYRVAYKLELTRGLITDAEENAGFDAGAVVLLGERHKLKVLRSMRLGAEVSITCGEVVKLKGGRTMHLFSIKSRGGTGASVGDHLTASFKAMGAGEVWNASPGEEVPF